MSRIAPPILVSQASCGLIDWAGKFGVDQQRESGSSYVRQRGAKLRLGDHGEPIDSGMDQKALEPGHARGPERFNLLLIVADHAAPSQPIHPASARGGLELGS